MKLIQVSTGGCRPCQQYRQYVHDNFPTLDIGYHYVDARQYVQRGFAPEEAKPLLEKVINRVTSVPHSFVIDNEGVLQEEWVGFSPQKINEYAYQTRPKYLKSLEVGAGPAPSDPHDDSKPSGVVEVVLSTGEAVRAKDGAWYKVKKNGDLYKNPIKGDKLKEIENL